MTKQINTDAAKEQLIRINDILEEPHLLIGGLAVQQYHNPRISKDIDLVCESETAKKLIDKLYPTKDYEIKENNDDEFRPSYEITHKIDKYKIIFFGPKIIEREPYNALEWEKLSQDSVPFCYHKTKYEKIVVPRLETLAFTKFLSFLNRIDINVQKGEQDLIDFMNLSNSGDFRINVFINHIRESHIENFITSKLIEHKNIEYNTKIWESSLFMDFVDILKPNYKKDNVFSDNFDELYKINEGITFYDKVANKYDERNTKFLLDTTHRAVISSIIEENNDSDNINILDIGSGTGRLIAAHFFDKKNFTWHCIEPSKKMIEQFKNNMKSVTIKSVIHNCSLSELNEEIKSKKYDIIIMSFILSSLSENPDFESIIKLLNRNGCIIIADSDPYLTQVRPFYDFTIDNKKIAFTPRKIDPIDIIKNIMNLGLQLSSLESIMSSENEKYSFLLKFKDKE